MKTHMLDNNDVFMLTYVNLQNHLGAASCIGRTHLPRCWWQLTHTKKEYFTRAQQKPNIKSLRMGSTWIAKYACILMQLAAIVGTIGQ